MSESSYGSVGTPRIFVDYIQYGKAIGIFEKLHYNHISLSTNPEALWDMNPSNVATFEITSQSDGSFGAYAKIFSDSDYDNLQFRHLLSTANYGALLGHNISTIDPERYVESKVQEGYASQSGILGRSTARQNVGTNIWKINSFVSNNYDLGDMKYFDRLGFKINRGNEGVDWNVGQVIKIGAFSSGRYYDFPYSPDLDVKISYRHEGIKTVRTSGGSDLRSYSYTKPKKWGDYSPWVNIDLNEGGDEDYSSISRTGKRTFDIKYSYLDKENIFPMNFNGNMALEYGSSEELSDNLIQNGTFADGTSYWNELGPSGSGWTDWNLSGGNATIDGSQLITTAVSQENVAEIGETFKIEFDITSTAGTIQFRLGSQYVETGGTGGELIESTGGVKLKKIYYAENRSAFAYNQSFKFTANSSFAGTIDNVSVKKVITPAGSWTDSNTGTHKDNIIGNFLTFTMGGQIPFIFQPDNEIAEFAICKLDKPSLKINQEANGVYSISMKFKEI
tara:strand:+ start:3239 stop:4753 length:1515 start_codon:yes stop_codon:yes gene_type:complete